MKYSQFLICLSYLICLNATAGNLDKVRQCLSATEDASDSNERARLAETCYQTAENLRSSGSLDERALFFRSWAHFLATSADGDLESTRMRLLPYYDSSLRPFIVETDLKAMDPLLLEDLYRSSQGMRFYFDYTLDQSVFEQVLLLWGEKSRRGLVSVKQAQYVLYELLQARKWSGAQAITRQFPTLEPHRIPEAIESQSIGDGEMGFYQMSQDPQTLTLKKFSFKKGPQIIMVGFCHYAWDAVKELSKYAEIKNAMKVNGFFLAGNNYFDFDFIGRLGKDYPDFEPHPIYRNYAWQEHQVSLMESPSFFFFMDGKLVLKPTYESSVVSQFCRGAKSIGLRLPHDCP